MNIIFGNYGNETLGVIQWAVERKLTDVTVISIDTGWAGKGWLEHVETAEAFAKGQGFNVVRLASKLSFADLIADRGEFPSTKFQWCAGFLKGLTLLDWLDEHDPSCEALLILGNRRALSRKSINLTEFIEESEHFDERKVWHPLYDCTDEALMSLVEKAGFVPLTHRSLECDPCVNNIDKDFKRIAAEDVEKTQQLEDKVGKPMFLKAIQGDDASFTAVVKWFDEKPTGISTNPIEMGCGAPFACGL
jgi:3'-phosphoadenosine 5'-phosphosulfate sulfotransferase (PAPS reductase)/FAD synthetase